MAKIQGTTSESIFSVKKWGGLNEHPDGDTRLKVGEASAMTNWRITTDGNLKRRPGLKHIVGLRDTYAAKPDDELTTIGTYSATDSVTIYSATNTTESIGKVILKTASTVTVAEAAAIAGTRYIMSHFAPFQIAAWTLENDVYTLTGYRLRAKPYSGGFITERQIDGIWSGYCGGTEMLLAACDGKLWRILDAITDSPSREYIGALGTTSKGVFFFPFDNKVYILTGYEYYVLSYSSGTFTLAAVTGYRPLIAISISPYLGGVGAESGELTGEYINRLNGQRRVWISPDGTNRIFKMPDSSFSTVDYITVRATGANFTAYSSDEENGTVTFTDVPDEGTNTYEIGYTVSTTYRSQVTGNLFAELYSGTTDTRIFLYGDGTNRAIYSGMDYDGMPRADYFPDSYEVRVGDENTPITGMIRHYAALVAYKPDECWALEHGIVELASDNLTPAVYCQPVNREIGNFAPGQVRLVNNSPVTLHRWSLYSWTNSSYYTSNLSRDERQAKRISDRIQKSIKSIVLKNSHTWDDNENHEYYIFYNNNDQNIHEALVWNYAVDAWYKYTEFPVVCMCNFQGNRFVGTTDGRIMRITDVRTDDGDLISAEWESGAMDFGAAYARKYCAMMWVGLKPRVNALTDADEETSVDVSVLTDRKDTFRTKAVLSTKARVDGEPFAVKVKLKAKKFVFYHLLLSSEEYQYPVTVTNVDFRVRQTGYAK